MTCGNINADELAEVIRRLSHDDPSLVDLTMSWSNLRDAGLEKLSDAIRFNNYLVDLDIYSNNITSAGLVRMGTALRCVRVCPSAASPARRAAFKPQVP